MNSVRAVSHSRSGRAFLAAALIGLAGSGCVGSDVVEGGSTGTPSMKFRGLAASSAGLSGVVELNVMQAGESTPSRLVRGTLAFRGAPGTIALSGVFAPGSGSLTAQGSGFALGGVVDGSKLLGEWTSPDGFSGGLAALSTGDRNVSFLCGTFSGDDQGIVHLVGDIARNILLLTAASSVRGPLGSVEGTLTGDEFAIVIDDVLFVGTSTGSSIAGTWESEPRNQFGSWRVSEHGCEAAVPVHE